MKLFLRLDNGRYREATPGEVIASATAQLYEMGMKKVAITLQIAMLDQIGYAIPTEVEKPEPGSSHADEG